jgi:hypothetical protein
MKRINPSRNSNAELEKKYGENANVLVFSHLGFSTDKSLALIHVSGGAGGALCLHERKNGKWIIKETVATWARCFSRHAFLGCPKFISLSRTNLQFAVQFSETFIQG